jgi:hypothetical protein
MPNFEKISTCLSFSTYCPLEILKQQEVHLLVWLVVVLDFCHLQHHVEKSGLEEVYKKTEI